MKRAMKPSFEMVKLDDDDTSRALLPEPSIRIDQPIRSADGSAEMYGLHISLGWWRYFLSAHFYFLPWRQIIHWPRG